MTPSEQVCEVERVDWQVSSRYSSWALCTLPDVSGPGLHSLTSSSKTDSITPDLFNSEQSAQ
jgi:hypothetical protein